MAETVRIEIPIETVDETAAGLHSAIQGLTKLEQAYKNTSQSASKANSTVSQFDKQAQKTEKSLARWAKEKYEILLEARERITPVLSTLGNGLRSFVGRTWNVTMRAVDLVTSPVRGIINLLKNPVFQVGAVLGVSIGLKDTIETYKDFEAAMSQVQAVSGATGTELIKLTDKAKEMGATTKFTAKESAEAFNYMAMAGWKTKDMLNGIEGILSLAAASGEDLATTSDIVTDALTAFNMKASDAGRFSDVLAAAASNANTTVSGMGETFKYAGSMAGSLGYSIEDVALMTGLMANTGVKSTMAGTALSSIFTRLATDTNGAAKALEKLGIKFYTSKGKARDLSDVMGELRKATSTMTAEEKSHLAKTVAGANAQKGLLAILNASEKDYNSLAKAINNADGAAAGMADTMLDNLPGSITLLQSAADGVKISFGERLSPYVRNIADWLTDQMPAIEQGLNEFMDWFDKKIDRMQRKFHAMADTKEWQDADFFGKVKIAWDEFIAEPFSEWWNSTGKAKFAGFAHDIGSGIGTGLKLGVMTLLGIDIGETLDEGVSIGASFAKGFSEGFDFKTISQNLWKGFGNMLSNAGKLLPGGESADLSSVLSAVMLSRIISPLFRMGRGAASLGKGLFGTNATTGTSLIGSIIGTTGNQMVQGTGLLNTLANAGYAMTGGSATAGGYFGAGTAMSGGTAAAVGAGGIIGAVGLIHGAMDLYTGFTSDDEAKAAAYKKAGAIEVGGTLAGAGAGAATGAAIGALFGGVGAVPGAFIGAGVGAIGSWIAGDKVIKEYEEDVEEMQKEAEKAKKVFEATGFSIDDVRFKNKALTKAMNDSEVSAEQFASMFQEECASVMSEAFGDIHLSLAEVKKVAGEITFAGMAEKLDEFSKAVSQTDDALNGLQSSISGLKKENWKVSMGMKLSETDQDSYKGAIDSFVESVKAYINDNHYEATLALSLLIGNKADTKGLDTMYEGFSVKTDKLSTEMSKEIENALSDGIIDVDEMKIIEKYQKKLRKITNKISEAKNEAQMQVIGIRYAGSDLDAESFRAMQEELQANVASASEQYENALTVTLTNLNLQKEKGVITEEEYDTAYDKAQKRYNKKINKLNDRVLNFNLDSIASVLSRMGIEEITDEKLKQAMGNAVLAHPDVETWKERDVAKWFGLDKLKLGTEEQTVIANLLKETALAVPKGTKETMLRNFKKQVPSADEIKEAIYWDGMTVQEWDTLMNKINPAMMPVGIEPADRSKTLKEYFGDDFEKGKNDFSQSIYAELLNSNDDEALNSFIEQYMNKPGWMGYGAACGNAFSSGLSSSISECSSELRTGMQTVIDIAATEPFTANPTVNVTPSYNIAGPTFPGINQSQSINGNAAGGYVSGGPQLSWLAEEGYGEFVIPTNPSRRSRALDIYEQAGKALGVSAYASGGYVKGSNPSDKISGYKFFNDENKTAPLACIETTWDNYNNEITPIYEPVSAEMESGTGGLQIDVQVNMTPEFIINGGDGQNEEDITTAIRRHIKEMADELGGELAGKLAAVFSNMPVKEA